MLAMWDPFKAGIIGYFSEFRGCFFPVQNYHSANHEMCSTNSVKFNT